jgi:hypothetical protein
MSDLAFDFIAIPKGQLPGGMVQTSAGDWVVVVPCGAGISLSQMVDMLVVMLKGRPPIEYAEIAEAIGRLEKVSAGK